METKSSSTAGLIGLIAVVAIVLFVVMTGAGPGSRLSNGWSYLTNGSQQSGQPQAQAAPSGPSIVGGPSLSASRIDTILSNAGSPAAGSGAEFTLDSATYNIDDAVALAFMHHESSYGTRGIAVQTHSLGNIICAGWPTCIGRFRSYSSWDAGIDDWYKLISGPAYAGSGLTTLSQIIPKYAPASDGNSESAYIQAVQTDVATWRAS